MEPMTKLQVDRAALKRAIAMARAESPGRAKQIDAMLAERPWLDVAQFAAYSCQSDALHLKPWQYAPCWMGDKKPVNDPQQHGLLAAWDLRRRLLAVGLSRYEPDPVAALTAAKPAA
jgi:hypothetical protein